MTLLKCSFIVIEQLRVVCARGPTADGVAAYKQVGQSGMVSARAWNCTAPG
jgi:hypothetical protein